jgi:hypothetical protein
MTLLCVGEILLGSEGLEQERGLIDREAGSNGYRYWNEWKTSLGEGVEALEHVLLVLGEARSGGHQWILNCRRF